MAKIGDRVRFLNTTGGGVITKIDGRIAYVEEDGFETPVLLSEIVVVLPAGHESAAKGAALMFDQKAFDEGKKEVREKAPAPAQVSAAVPQEELPVEETDYGETLHEVLVFEPENIKALSTSAINVALVNDSNYFLYFSLLVRDDAAKAWKTLYNGEVAPNEMIDLARLTQATVSEMERIVFQAIAYKKGKSFQVKFPLNVSKKIDLTKFFKVHCFRPGVYTDAPAIEYTLYTERHGNR